MKFFVEGVGFGLRLAKRGDKLLVNWVLSAGGWSVVSVSLVTGLYDE